ncbi:MAG: imidazolonepropionase [Saprospiraceae bacterium]|nr:imidazolonepropionase [Lewinella sp.]
MLITNIKELFGIHLESSLLKGKEMATLPSLEKAYVRIEGEHIIGFGSMTELKTRDGEAMIDAGGCLVMPAWCDSHTHLVFAGSREEEFVDKLKGRSYAEIAARGGGIQNSARRLQDTSEEALYEAARQRLDEIARTGTGAVEIKSGYGLSTAGELKMLRVIKRLRNNSRLTIKSTFLGAHALPERQRGDKQAYLREIIEEMLPVIAREGLADYIDVFCEKGFFDLDDTRQILRAGRRCGLKAKLHANQLHNFGAVQVGIEEGALSVDHLENISEAEIECLKKSNTIPTLLPTAAFFLRLPFPPARQMIDSGLGIALATDYNPGSSPSGNIPLLLAMSCIQMRLLPEEGINALTMNGACAMEVESELGSIAVGKKANLIISKPVPDLAYLPYRFGDNWINKVMIGGEII